jgi:phosphoglycerate kinase
MGVFEIKAFAQGTKDIAEILADLPATTIIGGGDSVAAVNQLNLNKNFTHISTGGGASLEFLQYGHLPAIDVLANR